MKKFVFDLEDVLELRKFYEEEALFALGQAIAVLTKIEQEIKQIAVKKSNALKMRFSNINDIAFYEVYILRLDKEAEICAKKAAKAQMEVDKKRAVYLEAEKEVKIMEELKDMQMKDYKKEIKRKEDAQNDELNAARKKELI